MASGRFTSSSYGGGQGMYLIIDWESSPVTSGNYSVVTATVKLKSYRISASTKSGTLTVDGQSTSFSKDPSIESSVWVEQTLGSNSWHIYHDGNGNKSCSMSASYSINISYSGVQVGTMNVSGTANLDSIEVRPGEPTNLSASGFYDNGDTSVLNWNKGSGTVTHHWVQYRLWYYTDNSYSGWYTYTQTASSSTSYSVTHSYVEADAIQFRVASMNNGVDSTNWSNESNWIYRQGVKVYDNGMKRGRIRVWNGSGWAYGYIYVWDGSQWKRSQ